MLTGLRMILLLHARVIMCRYNYSMDDILRMLKKEFLADLFFCGRMGGSGSIEIRIVRASKQNSFFLFLIDLLFLF